MSNIPDRDFMGFGALHCKKFCALNSVGLGLGKCEPD